MKSRAFAIMAALGAVGAFVSGPTALATPSAACPSGEMCVWSGTNYTGTMAVVPQDPWRGCVSSASLGLVGIRSAERNGVPCSLQAALYADGVCGRATEPQFVQNRTPNISPAALSMYRVMIPC